MLQKINISVLYGILHICVEVICFAILFSLFYEKGIGLLYIYALIYDFLAFVPQVFFGIIYDNLIDAKLEYIAVFLFLISIFFSALFPIKWLILLFMTLANAILHEMGAIITTSISNGNLSHSAIFVGGGSFGVIIGQVIGIYDISLYFLLIPLVVITLIILITRKELRKENRHFPEFNLVKKEINYKTIIFTAFIIVCVRSFIGYAIPISWKKEIWQSVLLFSIMGIGKILGGILSDLFGVKKVGILSTLICIPFLIFGDNIMIVSIIGVFLFSMTMSITFGMILSVMNKNVGLSFGITTIGLFLGVFPVFIFGLPTKIINIGLITILSMICSYGFHKILK